MSKHLQEEVRAESPGASSGRGNVAVLRATLPPLLINNTMEPNSQNPTYNSLPAMPPGRLNLSVTISELQEAKANELDRGRCLVTNISAPLGTIQCVQVAASTTKEDVGNSILGLCCS